MSTRNFIASIAAVAMSAIPSVGSAQTGRPPPVQKSAPLKIPGTPTPTPSSAPIKIGTKQETPGKKNEVYGFGSPQEVMDWMMTQPFNPAVFTWTAGNPPTVLPPVATHICMLTKVTGNFAGNGESIQLVKDTGAAGGPRFVLTGTSAQPQLSGSATCVEKYRFVPAVAKPQAMAQVMFPEFGNGGCAPHYFAGNKGAPKSAHFISTIGGKLRGGGERVATGFDKGIPVMRLDGCSEAVRGALTSIYDSDLPNTKYRKPTGRSAGTSKSTFSTSVAADTGLLSALFVDPEPFASLGSNAWMAPVDEALCGFVNISGKFQGYGEVAEILADTGPDGRKWWKLYVNSQAASNVLSVSARCIARDQR